MHVHTDICIVTISTYDTIKQIWILKQCVFMFQHLQMQDHHLLYIWSSNYSYDIFYTLKYTIRVLDTPRFHTLHVVCINTSIQCNKLTPEHLHDKAIQDCNEFDNHKSICGCGAPTVRYMGDIRCLNTFWLFNIRYIILSHQYIVSQCYDTWISESQYYTTRSIYLCIIVYKYVKCHSVMAYRYVKTYM